MPCKIMEDHRDAYFFWRELGLSNLPCVHVDAHLDVSDLKAPGCEISNHPEINCGNYLLPALKEDIVSELLWVIPEHLPGDTPLLEWTQDELQNWLHMDLAEFMSLHDTPTGIEGTLLGKPFTICFSKNLPPIEGPVLLDIDVDYYLGPKDEIWQSPIELADHLKDLEAKALTIAYSVQGGYTPAQHRLLGPLTEVALEDKTTATQLWEQDEPTETWPEWRKIGHIARTEGLREAAAHDPGYSVSPIDDLSAALMRGKFEEAEYHLEGVVVPTEADFMRGMLASKQKRFGEAADIWLKLLEDEELEPQTLVYLLTLCGRMLIQAERPAEALDTLKKAAGLARRDSEICYLQARALVALKEHTKAAKLYRKAIKLAPQRLETAEIKLELAELYIALGQKGLCERLLLQTVNGNTPGFMKLRAEALKLKLALARPSPA